MYVFRNRGTETDRKRFVALRETEKPIILVTQHSSLTRSLFTRPLLSVRLESSPSVPFGVGFVEGSLKERLDQTLAESGKDGNSFFRREIRLHFTQPVCLCVCVCSVKLFDLEGEEEDWKRDRDSIRWHSHDLLRLWSNKVCLVRGELRPCIFAIHTQVEAVWAPFHFARPSLHL